ncbi:MAG: 3-oxoacyl-ACP synthase, partial [Acidimicrobiales bacterium]
MPGARITGWGTALPDKIVTNADLEATLDTSDEWIRERSGIRERRIGGTTAGLAVEAGVAALKAAGVTPTGIDLLVLCTTTPDQTVPATSSQVQHELGLRCGAMDLNAACAGFVYGLVTSHAFIAAGARRVLLIGAETLSRILDWDDRNTAVLFADGAGAVVLEASDGPDELLGWDLGVDGSLRPLLYADVGGSIRMAGSEVFR